MFWKKEEKLTPFQEGVEAFYKKLDIIEDNPYKYDTKDYKDFDDGYKMEETMNKFIRNIKD